MTQANLANSIDGAGRDDAGAAALGLTEWLGLAAAPTFAIMALLTILLGANSMESLCSAGHGFPLSGMVSMYLLMSAFHSAPWLKLISSRQSADRSRSGLRTASAPPP